MAYHQKVHNSFKQRPTDRYHKCEQPIRRLPPHELVGIFPLEETRKVDKTNCISLMGTTYELEPWIAGESVQLRFDPYDMSVIQVWKDSERRQDARKLEKRSLRWAKDSALPEVAEQPEPASKTGLNYVELVYEKHMAEEMRKAQHGVRNLLKEGTL